MCRLSRLLLLLGTCLSSISPGISRCGPLLVLLNLAVTGGELLLFALDGLVALSYCGVQLCDGL